MDEYNDDYEILVAFNDACQVLADSFESLLPIYEINPNQDSIIQVPLMDLGADIDEWWGLDTGTNDKITQFSALYIEWLKSRNPNDYLDHFNYGYEILKKNVDLKKHYLEKLNNVANSEAVQIQYLPHVIRYAQDFLYGFDGVQALKQKCDSYNLRLSFMLTTNSAASHLHAQDAYCLSAIVDTDDHDIVLYRIGVKPDLQRPH